MRPKNQPTELNFISYCLFFFFKLQLSVVDDSTMGRERGVNST